MKKPFISVIIPALNEEKLIGKCLESVKNQKYPKDKYEIIVVDGNSTDRTREIAKKYGKVIIENQRGIGLARNRGAAAARGDILVFIDADTVITNNLFEEIEKLYSDPDVVGGVPKIIPEKRSFRYMSATCLINAAVKISSYMSRSVGTTLCISARKDAFEKINGFKENIYSGEDVDFIFRLSKFGKFKLISNAYSITSVRRSANWGEIYFIYRYLKGAGVLGKEKRIYSRVD